MAEFRCADAGATSCSWSVREDDEDQLVARVKEHLEREHDVKHVTSTLAKYARAVARREV